MRTAIVAVLLAAGALGCGGTTATPPTTPAPDGAPKTPNKGGAAMN